MIKKKMLPITLLPSILFTIFIIIDINTATKISSLISILLLIIGGICLSYKDFTFNVIGFIMILLSNIIMFFRMIDAPNDLIWCPMIIIMIIAVIAFFKDYIDYNITNSYY